MKLKCIAIGKTSTPHGIDQVQLYTQRIQRFVPFEWIELKEAKHLKNNPSNTLKLEGENVLKALGTNDTLILFDEKGKSMDSIGFARFMDRQSIAHKTIVFCIGGAYGFSESLRKRANGTISLSPMTFPHQLARVVGLEQIYRGCTIINNHPYHHV